MIGSRAQVLEHYPRSKFEHSCAHVLRGRYREREKKDLQSFLHLPVASLPSHGLRLQRNFLAKVEHRHPSTQLHLDLCPRNTAKKQFF